jgi:hypothetical protein
MVNRLIASGTHQSKISTLLIFVSESPGPFDCPSYTVRSHLAATAALLKKQNPIASSGSAW